MKYNINDYTEAYETFEKYKKKSSTDDSSNTDRVHNKKNKHKSKR